MENRRTIQTILSLQTGQQFEVNELFKDQQRREAEIFQLRTKIEEQLQAEKIEYVCIYCKQPVAIRGRKNFKDLSKHFYFTHPYKSDDCIIKTQCRLTEEQVRCIKYNGEKESKLHNNLKNLIGYYLQQDKNVSGVKVDQVYKDKSISKDWRKPDVLAIFKDKKIAFELQLSTTFLTVIVGRTIFYRKRDVFLIWVFPNFSLDDDLQKFTQKDVYYNNNFNVYVYDEEAQEKSKEENELILKCYYKEFFIIHETIDDHWVKALVKISELTFDFQNVDVYYYDSDSEKKRLQAQIEIHKADRIKREEEEQIRRNVERVAKYLKDFYKYDSEPLPRSEEFPLDNIKSQKDIAALDSKLKFTSDNLFVITKLFFNRNKPNFLKLICEQDNILVNISNLEMEGKSVFEELIYLENSWEFKHSISCLFRKGYKLNTKDKSEFDKLYQKNYFNTNEHEKEQIDKWAFINLFINLTLKERVFDVIRLDKILFAISSLKYNLVIGFRFDNHRQITHNFLEYHSDFGEIYIKAMKVYRQYETQLKQDKNGKLKLKIDKFEADKPEQEKGYNDVIYDIFPELQK